jgi:hypothetical protein
LEALHERTDVTAELIYCVGEPINGNDQLANCTRKLVHIVSSLLGVVYRSTDNNQITDSSFLLFQLHFLTRLRLDHCMDGLLDPGETFFRSHGFILPSNKSAITATDSVVPS